eukprot:SAG11_NODE_4963_length_1709_cov_0.933540_1_plen_206_part_00
MCRPSFSCPRRCAQNKLPADRRCLLRHAFRAAELEKRRAGSPCAQQQLRLQQGGVGGQVAALQPGQVSINIPPVSQLGMAPVSTTPVVQQQMQPPVVQAALAPEMTDVQVPLGLQPGDMFQYSTPTGRQMQMQVRRRQLFFLFAVFPRISLPFLVSLCLYLRTHSRPLPSTGATGRCGRADDSDAGLAVPAKRRNKDGRMLGVLA